MLNINQPDHDVSTNMKLIGNDQNQWKLVQDGPRHSFLSWNQNQDELPQIWDDKK